MENKNKIGALVMLGGIALLGYYYFKKNKPTTAKSQLEDLAKQSEYYKSGGAKTETKIVDEKPLIDNISINLNPFIDQSFVKSMAEGNSIRNENMFLYGTPTNPNAPIDTSNYIIPELANFGKITLSQEAINSISNMNTGLGGIDFSKVKI